MPYVESDGAQVYYETHGSGPGVLFVHGSGGHHAAWWQQVPALRDEYTVITMDLRGFGCSRWDGEHDSVAFPGDVIAVLDRLLTPEFRDRRPDLAFLFQQMGTFNTAKMADLRNLGSDGPTLEEVDAAPFPLLLLAGERDSVLSPATVRRAGEILGHARVEIVPGAPHSMYWETPSLFSDAVGRFLADVTAAGVTRA